ncbi:efflux transporter periplasmic adaptor subunit [Arachidicoccus ginsenosidimutans]|uniref:efflux RND transporter periplasmic adaptor subunit n=1 Tax=Arachidicoccus sp. BS20 TaxID=1850526 RepID=UPI0007F0707E|nr:efflux RND transporter periplasmic adaptor subunit [Arachidicoccus sp. BS20]ANI89185.1 efflux transporter periplasmic adaptor subunit [Arachidicoccus sp. BS20]
MNKIKQIFPAALLGIFLYSCNSNSSTNDDFSDKSINVTLAKPFSGNNGNSIYASGTVEAVQSAQIGTRMMGTITKVYVQIGDHVQKGQLLFTVNASDIEAKSGQVTANIAQAEAALANAKKDYDRFTVLYKQNSATAKELDNATLQYKSAQAQLNAAKQMKNEVNANMDYARVTAPFSGIITQKMMDAGSLASPGMPVLAMEQPGDLQVVATISENDIDNIHNGAVADVHIASADKEVQGTVTQISPSSAQTGGQFVVKIALPENEQQGILSGMYANVSFAGKTKMSNTDSQIMIPLNALVHKDELSGIYTISSNNTALLRWIRTGKIYGDKVEVLSGLQADEKFIAQADGRLYNGAPVKVK